MERGVCWDRSTSRSVEALALVVCLSLPAAALAQSPPPSEPAKAGEVDRSKLTDAERARRDADRVFNFIKFHAVRPAAAPAPAPAPARAAAAAPARPPAAAVSPAPSLPVTAPVTAAAVVVEPPPSAAAVSMEPPAPVIDPRTLPPAAPGPAASVPQPVAPEPAPTQPAAAPVEEADPGLKMVKYVAPELNSRAIASVSTSTAKVRVRFTVMPDGSVGKATAMPGAPRPLGAVATKAVEQWRFEPVKEMREVEVEVDFRFD